MTATAFFTILASILTLAAVAIYFIGIPPEMKRKLERQALKTMGENKMSYVAKDQISKIPTSDQQDLAQLKQTVGNTTGSLMTNPLGDATGAANRAWDSVTDLSKTAYERVATNAAWDSLQEVSAKTLERVATMTRTRDNAKVAGVELEQ